MTSEFNVNVSVETVREYVVPFALKKDTNIASLLNDLKSCGVSTSAGVSSVVIQLLMAGRMRDAAEIGWFF